jgi:hypothetical protein
VQPLNPYLRAALRFWWVLTLGVLLACIVAVLVVYRVDLGVPPTLEAKEKPVYTAGARVLVTSAERPYYRVTVEKVVESPATGEGEAPEILVNAAPDTNTLINAANLYPLLIESDQVAAVRRELIGPVRGVVAAEAVFSINTPGRFEPSRIPVIQILASGASPRDAVRLAEGTVDAFRTWITREQDGARIKAKERILIQQIQAPQPGGVVSTGGTSMSMPVLAAFAILLAFAGITLLLDRLYEGQRTRAGAVVERLEQRAASSKRA